LKNRKSARKSRRRRKAELQDLRDEIKKLKDENNKLRRLLKQHNIQEEEKESVPKRDNKRSKTTA